MSGFDFGALRDPDAPQPDSRHRDGVEARSRELRAKTRRNRTLLSGLAAVVVVATVAGIVATRPDPDRSVIVEDPSSTTAPAPPSSVRDRFVPPTTTENGITTLPVTLPDGEAFTMRYPEPMKIAELGFAGRVGVNATEASIRYSPTAHPADVPANRGASDNADLLSFRFGAWVVRVPVHGKTDAQRATLTRSLAGTVDANGYLLLHTSPSAQVYGFEGGFGVFPTLRNSVEIAKNHSCGEPDSDTSVHRNFENADGTTGIAWCDGDVHFSVVGSKRFVQLGGKLQVTRATAPTTSTTTTQPAIAPPNAKSASFVSADHGWLVEGDGTVAETKDGGATWRAVGSLGRGVANMKLRFADTKRGFAVPIDLADQATTLTTDDGGATWTALTLPFPGRIYDLAISRGTVYAVALDSSNFRIWSSPVGNLSWTEDPITIPVGGGPVPMVQLVFSHGAGWLVEVDRVVVAGAQMSTDGHWSKWTPPCSTANGPANLAASSATDLIASCDEGVWGSPPARGKAAYTSHDAGATFRRDKAPVFGSVTAADPNTALLATGYNIWRTIDGAKTWANVEGLLVSLAPGATQGQPLDLGFTSDQQGFVIFAAGTMVMTYDAGATWRAVTQP